MAKKENMTYKAAMTELESIMKILESGQPDVDDMVKHVQRASELIAFCQQKLTKTEEAIDAIFKEKEEKAPAKEEEKDKPVIVEDEKTSTEGGEKGDVEVRDEEKNVDDGNKNGPEYKPSIGGDNPFDDDTETEIDDKPVDDYVGEGEDRPGEGIHF